MAKFRVNNTFFLKSRNYFVLAGDIVDGAIGRGMLFNYKGNVNLKLLIHDVNFIDGYEYGKPKSEVALCIKYDEKQLSLFESINIRGIYSILK